MRRSGAAVIVTNTTFQMCPWADALFAFDLNWWKRYHEEVAANFHGRRFAGSLVAGNYGAEVLTGQPWFTGYRNSGASAVSIAISSGADRIVMLGYDLSLDNGKTHWHGDHPSGMGNAGSISDWPRHFSLLAKQARRAGAKVVNASRRTALTVFERVNLEDVL